MNPHAGTPFDLLIRNGHVIDPSQNWDGPADVGVRGGRIAAFGRSLPADGCAQVHDASHLYVCPGLIDLHGHWSEAGLYGINAEIGLNHGVTTAVDAGTTGFANFAEFRRTAIASSQARILAFVHISCLGLHAPFAEELVDIRYARPEETAEVVQQYSDVTAGVKIRVGAMTANHGNEALALALSAAETCRQPFMVHISSGADEAHILDRLRPGDILTHCFHGRGNGMIAASGDGFIPQVKSARERGIIFDIGHGCGSFSWESAQKAFEHHFWPDTISTDLHRYSVDAPWLVTMPDVMSKLLCLGMPLRDVIEKTTVAPARALRRDHELGSLRPGYPADISVIGRVEGSYEFTDAQGAIRTASQKIVPEFVVRDGRVIHPGDIPVVLRNLYDADKAVFGAQLPRASLRGWNGRTYATPQPNF
jgi:dihydroorotase